MKYLKKFENYTEYEEAKKNLILPNVSLCAQENDVYYNPWVETRVVAKYNVTNTSSPTTLRASYESNIFKSMEIDGVMLDELVTEYTFGTTGVHTVKYELYDETKLGNSAPVFYNSNLIECIIPDSVKSIGINAFYNCYSITSIDIPNSVTSIGGQAFFNCSSLTNVTIGNSVTSIGGNAFMNCYKLTSIDIPSGVTSIGNATFSGCSSLTSIDIPNSVTSIGDSAFYSCTGLTSCTIGSGVTSIGNSAFYYCYSLTSIGIPNSVTSIGEHAFYYCTSLTSVTVNATTPPTLSSDVFKYTNNCPIYVPSTSVDVYNGASGWSDYASRIQAIP